MKTTFNIGILTTGKFAVKWHAGPITVEPGVQKKAARFWQPFYFLFYFNLSPSEIGRALFKEGCNPFFEISRLARLDLAFVLEGELPGEII